MTTEVKYQPGDLVYVLKDPQESGDLYTVVLAEIQAIRIGEFHTGEVKFDLKLGHPDAVESFRESCTYGASGIYATDKDAEQAAFKANCKHHGCAVLELGEYTIKPPNNLLVDKTFERLSGDPNGQLTVGDHVYILQDQIIVVRKIVRIIERLQPDGVTPERLFTLQKGDVPLSNATRPRHRIYLTFTAAKNALKMAKEAYASREAATQIILNHDKLAKATKFKVGDIVWVLTDDWDIWAAEHRLQYRVAQARIKGNWRDVEGDHYEVTFCFGDKKVVTYHEEGVYATFQEATAWLNRLHHK